MSGRIDSWDTVWAYAHSKYEAVALLSVVSKVYNIGFDGTGIHCRRAPYRQNALPSEGNTDYRFPRFRRSRTLFCCGNPAAPSPVNTKEGCKASLRQDWSNVTKLDSLSGSASLSDNSRASMRVGINCLDVDPSFVGGVTTYALGLLEGFASAGNGCRFRTFVTEGNQHLFEPFRNRDRFEVVVISDRLFSLRSKVCRVASLSFNSGLYKFTSDLAFDKIREVMDAESDVLYTPTPVLRCFNSRKPTVLSMHDIQHVHHPEFFSWPRRVSRSITYGLSARHASFFQASSDYIKEDLLSHFRWLSPEQVEVIPSGALIERFATPAAGSSFSERYSLPERFLLFPAQLWPHKNHLTVLKALKQVETGHGVKIPLVLTGEKYSAAPQIFKFIADQSMGYVRYVGKVPFQDMVALYQKAAFMITATLHESSSLPILEAAAAGTPIIGSRIPPIEELGRVLQLNLFEPLDVDGLARLILALWNDEKTASSQAAHNRKHIGLYSWENTARKYIQFFERALNS